MNDKNEFAINTFGLVIIISLMTISCNSLVPAGFWKNFHKDLIVQDISDQGPWGGYRIIHWESKNNTRFEKSDILKFAKENGWTLIDSFVYGKKLPQSWVFADKPIFPYNYDESIDIGNQVNDKFPRYIESDFELYSFKTGLISINPGTGESVERTGFILLSFDIRGMTVYHLWGE